MISLQKILFITKYPIEGPSSRYRVYQYIEKLKKEGFNCEVKPLMSSENYKDIYLKDINKLKKYILRSQIELNKIFKSFDFDKYDLIFIQKEITPWFITSWFLNNYKDKIVFDFDDAIFFKKTNKYNLNKILSNVRWIIAGNSFLEKYALKFNDNVSVIPTPIDLKKYNSRKKHIDKKELTLGWVGTKGNLKYIDQLKEIIYDLSRKYNFALKIVSNADYEMENVNVINKRWSLNGEIADIKSFDIGIMPLEVSNWTKGKCAFKAIQYMGLGIPTVSSNVGFNKEVITDGKDGYLVSNSIEWKEKIELLLNDCSLRNRIGKNSRLKVKKQYSVEANYPKLVEVFNKALNTK